MTISDEERSIIERILEHSRSGATDMLPEVMLNPVSNYSDPERLRQEIDVLFRNFPIIVAHSSELAAPGDFLTHDATGVPILVTRTPSGEIKAFLNVCRHRGARIEDRPCGATRTFSCPYHAWTYDLDGRLRGMPEPHGFDGVKRSDLGLAALPAFERFGLIWVRPSAHESEIDIDAWLAPMEEQLAGLGLEDHVIFRKWSLDRNMGWRLALEGFQECYHFCAAHKHTACSSYLDNQSVFLDKYPHVRHAVPLPKVEELRDRDPEEWRYRPYFMTQNYLFPANFAQVMTDHVYIHTIIPTGPGTCVFECMMLIPEAPESEKAERYWERNFQVVRTVFDEDFVIGESIQKGLDAGANTDFVFGRYECGLHYGRVAIDDALAGRLSTRREV